MPVLDAPPAFAPLFPLTGWTALRRQARDGWTAVEREAMRQLCLAYAGPLEVYLECQGRDILEAEALVLQFLELAISQEFLLCGGAGDVRFRDYLLTRFMNWMTSRDSGGKADAIATQAYEREWARVVVSRAMGLLKATYEECGRLPLFLALAGLLPGGGDVTPSEEIGIALGMTEPAVQHAANELRASCADFLRAEVGLTLLEPEPVDEELRYLLQLLRTE